MKLTGKCKDDFFKWLEETDVSDTDLFWQWYKIPESMQYGVYVDFFDSVGLSIGVYKIDISKWFGIILKNNRYLNNFKEGYSTLSEARTEAIKKANEIYNKK